MTSSLIMNSRQTWISGNFLEWSLLARFEFCTAAFRWKAESIFVILRRLSRCKVYLVFMICARWVRQRNGVNAACKRSTLCHKIGWCVFIESKFMIEKCAGLYFSLLETHNDLKNVSLFCSIPTINNCIKTVTQACAAVPFSYRVYPVPRVHLAFFVVPCLNGGRWEGFYAVTSTIYALGSAVSVLDLVVGA